MGGFQKCYKQLERRNRWAPCPLSGLSWGTVKLGTSLCPGRRLPPSTWQPVCQVQAPTPWLGVSQHPSAPPPKRVSPRGKTEGMGSSEQKPHTQDTQEARARGGSRRGNRGAGAGFGGKRWNYFLPYLFFKHLNIGLCDYVTYNQKPKMFTASSPIQEAAGRPAESPPAPPSTRAGPEQERGEGCCSDPLPGLGRTHGVGRGYQTELECEEGLPALNPRPPPPVCPPYHCHHNRLLETYSQPCCVTLHQVHTFLVSGSSL